jgi:hypothetical protein
MSTACRIRAGRIMPGGIMAGPAMSASRWPRVPVAGIVRLAIACVVAACLLAAADAWACPNCKDAVDTADPDGMNLARGYFYSILIMLAMPLTLVGSFGIYVWREMRRQERLGTGGAGSVPPDAVVAAPATPGFDSRLAAPPP